MAPNRLRSPGTQVQQHGDSFWGGIMHNTKTGLIPIDDSINGQMCQRDTLKPIVTPTANFILVQDNACPHRARII